MGSAVVIFGYMSATARAVQRCFLGGLELLEQRGGAFWVCLLWHGQSGTDFWVCLWLHEQRRTGSMGVFAAARAARHWFLGVSAAA